MGHYPHVRIGNANYKNQQILDISFSISTAYNSSNGERTGTPVHGTINIVKRMDEADNVWEFAQERTKSKMFDGEIVFVKDDDESGEYKKLAWKEGFITHYEVRATAQGSAFTTESISISAREVTLGKVASKMNWAQNKPT